MASKLNSIAACGTVASSIAGTTSSSYIGKAASAGISYITTGTDTGINVGIKKIANREKELP